jgi:hypothetical protein
VRVGIKKNKMSLQLFNSTIEKEVITTLMEDHHHTSFPMDIVNMILSYLKRVAPMVISFNGHRSMRLVAVTLSQTLVFVPDCWTLGGIGVQ